MVSFPDVMPLVCYGLLRNDPKLVAKFVGELCPQQGHVCL